MKTKKAATHKDLFYINLYVVTAIDEDENFRCPTTAYILAQLVPFVKVTFSYEFIIIAQSKD